MFTQIGQILPRVLRSVGKGRGMPEVCDPDADEFFTVIDGEPLTFRQFNARLERHFSSRAVRTPPVLRRVPAQSPE